jgi:hypothetical protein
MVHIIRLKKIEKKKNMHNLRVIEIKDKNVHKEVARILW